MRHLRSSNNERGFTYLMVMFFVVMIGISLMTIGQQWSVTMKRDREAELLFRGTRIQKAIERYSAEFQVQKGTRPNQYPLTLKELTKKPNRFLQKIYIDPMTGEDFELIKVNGQIRGVRSTSTDTPFDQVNFKGAATYSAIRFEAQGQSGNCIQNAANPFLPANCSKTPQGSAPAGSSPSTNAPTTTPSSPSGSTPTS